MIRTPISPLAACLGVTEAMAWVSRPRRSAGVIGLIVCCLFSLVATSCGSKHNVKRRDITGVWSSTDGAKARLALNINGTFVLTGLPAFVLNGHGDVSKKTLSRNGSWAFSQRANSKGAEAYIDLYFGSSKQFQPQATLNISNGGRTCYFALGDPDDSVAYTFRKADAP